MITSLKYSGVKGRAGHYKLGPLTAVLGDNRSGKTAFLSALDLAMLKYVPRLSKVNKALFKALASGPRLEAAIDTSQGRNELALYRKGDTISLDETFAVTFDPVMRDSALYFGLSGEARLAMVAGLYRGREFTGFSVPELLASVKGTKLKENTKASEEAVAACHAALFGLPACPPLEWLEKAAAHVKQAAKAAKDSRDRMEAVGAGLAELQAKDEQAVLQASAVERNADAKRVELEAALEAASQAGFEVNEAKRRAGQKEALLAVQPPPDRTALEAEAVRLKGLADAAKLAGVVHPPVTQLRTAVRELESAFAAMSLQRDRAKQAAADIRRRPLPPPGEVIATVENEYSVALQRVKSWKRKPDLLAGMLKQLGERRAVLAADYRRGKEEAEKLLQDAEAFSAMTCCPTCRADGTGWKARKLAESEAALLAAKAKQDDIAKEGGETKALIEAAQAEYDTCGKQQAEHDAILARLEKAKAAQVLVDNHAQELRIAADFDGKAIDHGQNAEALAIRLENARSAVTAAEEAHSKSDESARQAGAASAALTASADQAAKYTAAQEQLAALGPSDVPAAQALHQRLQSVAQAKRLELQGLQGQLDQVASQRSELARQTAAVIAAEAAQAEVDVLKVVAKSLSEKRAELVGQVFAALLDVTNKFTSSVIPHPVEYRDGDVGYQDGDGQWCPAEGFSGAEEAVLFAGLCCALAHKSAQRVVILDEMNRFDAPTKPKVLARLAALVADGTVHQVLVADPYSAGYEAAGFQIIAMQRAAV